MGSTWLAGDEQQQTATRLASVASILNAMRCNESDHYKLLLGQKMDAESHKLFRENCQMSKKDYLLAFHSSLYDPLHV